MSARDVAVAVALTKNLCPMCGDRHSRDVGITIFIRHFTCSECGTLWKDSWCADCNDRCPTCKVETEPDQLAGDSIEIEEAVFDYRVAKTKAAQRLRLNGRSSMPENARIQQAVM